VSFAEQLVSGGKLAPKHKDAVVAFLDFSEADDAPEFGEGDAKQPLAGAFKAFLGDMPKVVEFAEQATHGRATTAATDDDAQFAEQRRPRAHQATTRPSRPHGPSTRWITPPLPARSSSNTTQPGEHQPWDV